MRTRFWQALVATIGAVLLGSVAADSLGAAFANAHIGISAQPAPGRPNAFIIQKIHDPKGIDGPAHIGDVVQLEDGSLANELRFSRERPGDRFVFVGRTAAGAPTRFVATMLPIGPAPPSAWILELMRVVVIVMGLILAARRPNEPLARLLVGLFFALAAVLTTGAPSFPLWLVGVAFLAHTVAQISIAWAALALAVTFPARSPGGVRRWLERANLPYGILCLTTLLSALVVAFVIQKPAPPWLQPLGLIETVLYFVAVATAFAIAGRGASGADRKRVQWIAWTFAAGFSGTLFDIVLIALKVPLGPIYEWPALTLIAIPFGLVYAILRHRVVDIGFVVNRALVFGSVSAIVVIAFGVLEWVLSNVFVRVSHITSTSLELALALVLGFSLRTIHAKVDAAVDDVFFRERHAAERALRTFAREVAYITAPRIAVERAHAELLTHTGAGSATVYVVEARNAVRVDPAESAAPDALDVDDAVLVRLRATRAPLALRTLDTALPGEWAFPMCVRDAVTGLVVLGPKTNGEAYAPDELATIETVALALGNALDALQTAALKAEVARVLLDGAPVEALRRTVDASWVRGVVPQPAGSRAGLSE